ncbi:hypothetical protein JTB14_003881 [Gonioctena quinquepunctata]|nr:hypothetical protein JTB14_003881 [Gonioctena quinquepunctata]
MVFDREVKPAILKGTVSASMKKRTYSIEVSINVDDDTILDVSCTCPRGLVKCHHIAALCIYGHHNVSVTDQACRWSAPSMSTEEDVKTIAELYPKQKTYHAICGDIPEENITNFLTKLGQGNVVGYSWLLRAESEVDVEDILPSVENLVFSKEYLEASDRDLFLREKLCLTQNKVKEVVNKTIGQAKNENWLIARKNRLTASNFGAVLAAVNRQRYPPSLFKKLLNGYDLSLVMAIQWGKEHENVALNTFSDAFDNMDIIPTGLWLDESGFLGASPDGLCGDSAIVEVKCPYKFRAVSLSEALRNDKSYIIYKEGDATLMNYNHDYYHQIQGQLHLTKRDVCYLVVWTPNECEVVSVPIKVGWEPNLEILRSFYLNRFIPHVAGINK